MEYKLISIDLAKTVFQVAAFNPDNTIAFNRKVSRSALLDTLRQCAPTLVVMELMPAQFFLLFSAFNIVDNLLHFFLVNPKHSATDTDVRCFAG